MEMEMCKSFTKIFSLFAGRDVKCSLDVKWPGPLKMCTKIKEKRNMKLNFCSKFISNSRSKGTSTDQEALKILKARRYMILSYEIHLIHQSSFEYSPFKQDAVFHINVPIVKSQ